MYRASIAVVDASRARLFTYERTSDAEGLHEKLVEQRDFVNPARRLTPAQQLSDSPGSSRTGANQHFGYNDHRDAYIDKLDLEFSRMVNSEIDALVRASGSNRLILCASPRMLGHLRETRNEAQGVTIVELPRDLVKLTPPELREHLEGRGLLPARPGHERRA